MEEVKEYKRSKIVKCYALIFLIYTVLFHIAFLAGMITFEWIIGGYMAHIVLAIIGGGLLVWEKEWNRKK